MYSTSNGQPITKDILIKALTKLANLLKKKNKKLDLVVCGGVVSLLYLESRQMTHDVDAIFPSNHSDSTILRQLIDEVADDMKFKKSRSKWFNDDVSFFGLETISDVIVFNHPNLKLRAASWEELLSHKINAFRHNVDTQDAIEILKRINNPIKDELFSLIKKYTPFATNVSDMLLEERFNLVWNKVYS